MKVLLPYKTFLIWKILFKSKKYIFRFLYNVLYMYLNNILNIYRITKEYLS